VQRSQRQEIFLWPENDLWREWHVGKNWGAGRHTHRHYLYMNSAVSGSTVYSEAGRLQCNTRHVLSSLPGIGTRNQAAAWCDLNLLASVTLTEHPSIQTQLKTPWRSHRSDIITHRITRRLDQVNLNWNTQNTEAWREPDQCSMHVWTWRGVNEDLPHAAWAGESTITFTTQPLREEKRERGRERDVEMTSPYFSPSSSEM